MKQKCFKNTSYFSSPQPLEAEADALKRLLEVSRGERSADLFIRGGRLINVYSGEIYPANLAVSGGRIAYAGPSEHAVGPDTRLIEAEGHYLSPGYIEPHAHPSIGYNPVTLAEKILPLGTTTAVCDDFFFRTTMTTDAFESLIFELSRLPLNIYWMARCVHPSLVHDETGADGQEAFALGQLTALLDRPDFIATAEITRWPAICSGDPDILKKILAARLRRKRVDGHTAGASAARLNSLAAAGVSSCHEAITAGEVLDRLRLGFWVLLRNSSLRPDLKNLLSALTESGADTGRVMMTTDGPIPPAVEETGFTDGLLRLAVSRGLSPIKALQMCTLNPAAFFGLDQEIGGLAPGRRADILILPDLKDFRPDVVIAGGRITAELGRMTTGLKQPDWHSFGTQPAYNLPIDWAELPRAFAVPAPASSGTPEAKRADFPVIDLIRNVISRRADIELSVLEGLLDPSSSPGVLHISLIDRDRRRITRGFIRGLADNLEGLATTFTTSLGILAIGSERRSMAQATRRVVEMGGGLAIVEDGKILFELPLPIAGLMSPLKFGELASRLRHFDKIIKGRGYRFHDPLYSLLFITCDFLPGLRITPAGLLDVKDYRIVRPAAELQAATLSGSARDLR